MKVSSETAISMPMKNLLSIVAAVAVGVWAYFGVIERLNRIETNEELLRKDLTQATERIEVDLEKNTEFRIKWPRGEMGSLPADNEQFMLIEHLSGQLDKMITDIESGNAPYDQQQKLTLDFYEKRISKLEERVDALKQRGNN